MTHVDALVVGAGIHGLCTAFALSARGVRRIAVVERHGPGHTAGSSHGALRITRSSYHDRAFVALAAQAHAHGWPRLEAALGQPLRVPTPGVFFGPPDGPFGAYLDATLAASDQVEVMPVGEARRRFPVLRFDDGDAVLLDRSAAMLLAAAAMHGLRAWCAARGIEISFGEAVARIESTAPALRVATSRGTRTAAAVAIAAGPWLPSLAGPAAPPLAVLRQQVGYFELEAPTAALHAGAFPVWARIGQEPNDFHYGLPAHGLDGVKAAQHVTAGPGVDPDSAPPPVAAAALLDLARRRFACPVRSLQRSESCLYTMTADQTFAVRAAAHDRRIVTIAACSGHAFKFAPVIGDMAAALLQDVLGGPP